MENEFRSKKNFIKLSEFTFLKLSDSTQQICVGEAGSFLIKVNIQSVSPTLPSFSFSFQPLPSLTLRIFSLRIFNTLPYRSGNRRFLHH